MQADTQILGMQKALTNQRLVLFLCLKLRTRTGDLTMEYIYINGEVIVVDLETANNEDMNGLLDWIEKQEK